MSRGIKGKALAADGTEQGALPFLAPIKVFGAGDSSLTLMSNSQFKFKVINAWVIMNAAGASSDTVKLTNAAGDNLSTAVLSVSSAADGALVPFATILDSVATIEKGGSLIAVTASGARVDVYALCVRVEG